MIVLRLIVLLDKAWNEISESILVSSWKNVLRYDDDEFEPEDSLPLSELADYLALIKDAQAHLNQLNPNSNVTNGDIEQWNDDIMNANEIETETETAEIGDDDDDDGDEESDCVSVAVENTSHSIALDCVNQLLKWCNENQSTAHVSGLLDLRTEIVDAAKKQPKKQSHIGDYFVKQT